MNLKIKKDNEDYATIPLLEEKLGGVELPYLHVKKGDKTWYAPIIEKEKIDIPNDLSLINVNYKRELYTLLDYTPIILTWENGRICRDNEIEIYGLTAVFNKAKQCSLYGDFQWKSGTEKLMEINFGDSLLISSVDQDDVEIYNLTTKKLIKNRGIRVYNLEFREE